MALKGVKVFPELAFGELDNALLVVWRDSPTVRTNTILVTALAELCERQPDGAAVIQIVEPSSKPPDQEARMAAVEGLRQIGRNLKAVAFVFEGNHFITALKRNVLATFCFFQKNPHPTKVFRDPPSALAFAASRVEFREGFSSDAELALTHLRRLLDHSHVQTGPMLPLEHHSAHP